MLKPETGKENQKKANLSLGHQEMSLSKDCGCYD